MAESTTVNRRIVLNSRPVGAPIADNFRLEEGLVPEPGPGQVLLRTLYLSLDPYMRGRMSDARSYAAAVAIGEVMVGGTVSQVAVSRHPDYQPGDLVLASSGWQEYALSDGTDLVRLDARMSRPSTALGVLGMPGFTAYMGLLDIGQPQAGETVVVAAASGAVGSVVGQIARIKGCRAVGIAGGAESAVLSSMNWVSMPASITAAAIYGRNWPPPARKARRLFRERRRPGLRRCPAPAQCQGPRTAVRPDRPLQRDQPAGRSGPPGAADPPHACQAHQDSRLHYLRRLRSSLRRVPEPDERLAQGGPDQVP